MTERYESHDDDDDDESDKHLEARDRRYSCLIWRFFSDFFAGLEMAQKNSQNSLDNLMMAYADFMKISPNQNLGKT